MTFFEKYPYTDFHELNLDWIISTIMKLTKSMTEFEAVNKITFSGAWDITKQYPAWTIVDDGGMGYVSITPVPAGVDISNGNYWRLIADYTVLIAGLQARMIAVENRMDDVEADMDDVERDVDTLNARVDLLTKPYYVLCSDSYGVMSTWISNFVSIMGLTADDYVNEAMNAAAFEDQGNDTFYRQLTRAAGDVPDLDKVTDIIIIGGLNDTYNAYTDTGQLFSAMQGVDTYAKATFPNAKIHLGFVGMLDNEQTTVVGTDMTHIQYTMIRYIDYANQLGWNYISNIEYALHGVPNMMQADGVHPNSDGGLRIARLVAQGINTGSCDVKHFVGGVTHLTATAPTNWTFATYFDMTNYEVDNNQTTFNIATFKLTSSGISTTFNNIELGIPVSDLPFNGNMTSDTFIADVLAMITYDDGGTKYALVPAELLLVGKGFILQVKAFDFGANNWLTKSISAVETITPARFILPTVRI